MEMKPTSHRSIIIKPGTSHRNGNLIRSHLAMMIDEIKSNQIRNGFSLALLDEVAHSIFPFFKLRIMSCYRYLQCSFQHLGLWTFQHGRLLL